MYIIKEKLFDIRDQDVSKFLEQATKYYKLLFPNWGLIDCDYLRLKNMRQTGILFEFNTKELDSTIINSWQEDFPLIIFYGFFEKNSYTPKKYPLEKHKDDACIIQITFPKNLLNIVRNTITKNKLSGVLSLESFKPFLQPIVYKDLFIAFSKERLVDALTHELSHYLDDIQHNEHISTSIDLLKKDSIKSLSQFYNSKNIDRSYMEFNAQVHAISVIKQRNEKFWNSMTIFDVINKDLSLTGMYRNLVSIDIKIANEWLVKIQKRLAREKILGQKMSFIPKNNSFLLEDYSPDTAYYNYI